MLNAVGGQIHNGVSWTSDATVLEIDVDTNKVVGSVGVTSVGATGTASGDTLPPAIQGLAMLRTGIYANGREVRGRLFLPGPTEGVNTSGAPNSTYTGAWQSALQTLANDSTNEWVVYSRVHHVTPVVFSVQVWGKWASLRKRRD
jgi:hypothetical protein